jgi:virulence-associated protein VagC
MKTRVTDRGVLIPKELLIGIDEVEIRKEQNRIVVVPIFVDPILQLGREPIDCDVNDVSDHHDRYLYGQ